MTSFYCRINDLVPVRDKMSSKQHQEYLFNLCRICRKQAQTDTQIRKKACQRLCENVQDETFIFYGLHISTDTDDHPKVMCCHCYNIMVCIFQLIYDHCYNKMKKQKSFLTIQNWIT